jgi:hypothetical protein
MYSVLMIARVTVDDVYMTGDCGCWPDSNIYSKNGKGRRGSVDTTLPEDVRVLIGESSPGTVRPG